MRRVFLATAIILLLLFFARLVQTAVIMSATFDEPLHLLQGALYWQQTDLYSVVQNPPLINALMGVPLRLAFQPQLPPDMGEAVLQDWLSLAKQFLWETNTNGLQMLFGGRLAIIGLAMLLAALVARWAGQLFGWKGALFALLLFTFDPNILAHASLATTDLGTAVFVTVAAYSVWHYWIQVDTRQHLSWMQFGLVGLTIGLTLVSKFSGIIFVPALILIVIFRVLTRQEQRAWQRPFLEILGWLLIGTLILLVVYRFEFPALQMDFDLQQAHQSEGHSSFLFGHANIGGWWYYFPAIFTVKTPLIVLLFIVISFFLFMRRWPWKWSQTWLWLLVFGFAGASLISRVNIGYRYLLPVLPLLYVLVAQFMTLAFSSRTWIKWGLIGAVLWIVAESIWLHPHYLAYFNQLVGGPDNGWQVAIDSNVDWGQDVAALAKMQQENEWPPLHANWLGTAPPEVYGLNATFLPGWPWKKMDPRFDDFYPDQPTAGWYALSATQLQGVYLPDTDYYSWFNDRQPTARVGHSFFVYEVPAEGQPAAVGLSGVGVQMIDLEDYEAAFNSNDVRLSWFDARSSFFWPGGEKEARWVAVGSEHIPTDGALRAFYPAEASISGETEWADGTWRYGLYTLEKRPSLTEGLILFEETAVFEDTLQYIGIQPLWQEIPSLDGQLDLLTFWRVHKPLDNDLKIFVHLLNENGELIAQHDGLDVQSRGLLPEDEIIQLHSLQLPTTLPSGDYIIRLGIYETDTLQRLKISTLAEDVDNLTVFRLRIP